jgi:hypothetical protein
MINIDFRILFFPDITRKIAFYLPLTRFPQINGIIAIFYRRVNGRVVLQ